MFTYLGEKTDNTKCFEEADEVEFFHNAGGDAKWEGQCGKESGGFL